MTALLYQNSAIVLLAHGSKDPLWRLPIEATAVRVQTSAPNTWVRCAYLESTAPDLKFVVTELQALGVTEIRVLPMFLGMGKHVREDLPRTMLRLSEVYPHLRLALLPSVGESTRVIDVMAQLALEALKDLKEIHP